MRRHLVAVVTSMVIAATASCSGGNDHEAIPSTPPAFTPSGQDTGSTQNPDQRIVNAINPCALVTPDDLREITKREHFPMGLTPAGNQSAYERSCHYGTPEPTLRVTTLLDTKKDGVVWQNFVKNHGLTQRVAHVGDEAFGGKTVLIASRSDRAIVSFELATPDAQPPTSAQLVTLMRRALDRIASST